jgi:2-amino-4-hydroxy-6-hydroxymethyldihydropteridine diphosphokinase
MNQAYLLTGGNLGNRAENLLQAIKLIGERVGSIIASSSVYETAAWGTTNQPDYLNQCLLVETGLDAELLLEKLLDIEKILGRLRQVKYGSRTIDLDILLYNKAIINTKKLSVPHPQMQNRRFVLRPLVEIAPNFVHPVFKKTMVTLLNECNDPLNVKKISV